MVKCELCNTFTLQFNNHIKRRHPGCGQSAARKGYDSSGSYVDVWFKGECGSNFPFYLLCSSCREKYLAANLNDQGSKYERSALQPVPMLTRCTRQTTGDFCQHL